MINKQLQNGFTLIEMIVSVALFGIVVAVAIGSLVSLFNANNRAQSIASVVNNLNYSIENMARIIRFADSYHCGTGTPYTSPNSCSNGDVFFAVSTSTNPVIFRWNGTNRIEMSYNGGPYIPVTSEEVTVNYARFYVFNTDTTDTNQPYILINIRGYSGSKSSAQSSFDIQTVVSQKKLDI